MDRVFLQILTTHNLGGRERGEQFFEMLRELNPDLLPQFYNVLDPINLPFDPDVLETPLAMWEDDSTIILYLRRRRKPKYSGGVFVGQGATRRSNDIYFDIDKTYFGDRRAVLTTLNLIWELCQWSESGLTYMHLLHEQDVDFGVWNDTINVDNKTSPYLSVTGHTLIRYLPDLYWLTVFGRPYVEMFGRERLLSAPAYRVEELPYGGVWMQLSESPLDMHTDYARLDTQRQAIKRHLNHNAFFDSSFHPAEKDFSAYGLAEFDARRAAWFGTHTYDVPEFDLSEIQTPPEDIEVYREALRAELGVLTIGRPDATSHEVRRMISFRLLPPRPEDIEAGWKKVRQLIRGDLRKYAGKEVKYTFLHELPADLDERLRGVRARNPRFDYTTPATRK